MTSLVSVLVFLVFLPMAVEAARASSNERTQLARGGIEPSGDVYGIMQYAYPGAFLFMIAEGLSRGAPPRGAFVLGLAIFVAAKALKWWAILSLGPAWTFRVIVVPGMSRVTTGPYRWLRHPNYVAVVGELVGTALMTGAVITGSLGTLGFGVLIWRRIQVEQTVLDSYTRGRAR